MKIIITAASKGGVGKSYSTANLAFASAKLGKKCGLLDSDITMPAIAKYLRVEGKEPVPGKELIEPIDVHGVKVISTGLLLQSGQAVMLDGQSRLEFMEQFIDHVNWGVDYLFVDTPPGANDEMEEWVRKRRKSIHGVISVCTPSVISTSQVARSINLFKEMRLKIFGVIGNMATIECPEGHHEIKLYPKDKPNPVEKFAEDMGIKFLMSVPYYVDLDEHPFHYIDRFVELLQNNKEVLG